MIDPSYQANSYKNIMEILVDEEIDRQTRCYSQQDAQAINRIEVAAYALNFLPPLYASSQEGADLQYDRGRQELGDRIANVVLRALSIITKKPQRDSTPFSLQTGLIQTSEGNVSADWVQVCLESIDS